MIRPLWNRAYRYWPLHVMWMANAAVWIYVGTQRPAIGGFVIATVWVVLGFRMLFS